MMDVKRSDSEVNQVLNQCSEAEEKGESIAPGASYEETYAMFEVAGEEGPKLP